MIAGDHRGRSPLARLSLPGLMLPDLTFLGSKLVLQCFGLSFCVLQLCARACKGLVLSSNLCDCPSGLLQPFSGQFHLLLQLSSFIGRGLALGLCQLR